MKFKVLCLLAVLIFPVMAMGEQEKEKAVDEAVSIEEQENADVREENTVNIEETVVTTTRSEQVKEDVPSVIDVISSFDLKATGERDLTGLLKKNSSVDVIEYPGALSGISIRGFRPEYSGITKHTLILINGKPSGATNLATLLKDNVERIEVLKGPSSSLYGAESMGGVVNIITKKSTGEMEGSVSAGYGSFDKYYVNFSKGGKITEKLDFDLSATKEGRDDFSQGSEDIEKALVEQNNLTRDKRPNTETDERSIDLRVGSSLTDALRIDLTMSNYYANIETPGGIYDVPANPSNKELENNRYDFSLAFKTGKSDINASLYAATEDNFYLKFANNGNPYKSSLTKTSWKGCQVTDTLHFDIHDLTFGFDYQEIDVEGKGWNADGSEKSPYRPNNSRKNIGFYFDDFMKLLNDSLVVNAGARFDTFDLQMEDTPYFTNEYSTEIQSFEVFNPRLGLKYFFTDSRLVQVHSTIGTAFVPPNAYEIAGNYESYGTMTVGNPNLDPEKSLTWDLGVTLKDARRGFFIDITYFDTDVEDKIVEYAMDDETRSYRNSAEANINGIEWELSYDVCALLDLDFMIELFFNGTCLIESEEYAEGEWQDIQNVSDIKYNIGVKYDRNTSFAKFSMRHIGEMYDTDWDDINDNGVTKGDIISYGDFDIFDFSAGVTVLSDHTFTLSVDNILDTYYYEKGGYPLEGRTFYVQYTYAY